MPPHKPKVSVQATADLSLYHQNPRRGNTAAIAESLRVSGQYRPIVVNKGTKTGRALEVLAGNHTLMAARELGWDSITCWLLDVDEQEAARIVAADNRTAELGGFDDAALLELLDNLPTLEGTGYDLDDLETLRDLLDGPLDLDGLHDEVGDPKPDDFHKVVRLVVEPEIKTAWAEHRKNFADDSIALADLLDTYTQAGQE